MGRYSLSWLAAAIFSVGLAQAADAAWPDFFEQTTLNTWRGWGAAHGVRLSGTEFSVEGSVFKWNASLGLKQTAAEDLLESRSYDLTNHREQPHARRVRSSNPDGSVSVVYYIGVRGLEFDIELAPHATKAIELELPHGNFALDADGGLLFDGARLALKPVAYQTDADGTRHWVEAHYTLRDAWLHFELGAYDATRQLIIDPVMTYATNFPASSSFDPFKIRELTGGDLLLAGISDTPPVEDANDLTGSPWVAPADTLSPKRCYIARLSPSQQRIKWISYFGDLNAGCQDFDLDSQGRILLVGYSTHTAVSQSTPDAQFPWPVQDEYFLARISANGRTLEYSTFLRIALSGDTRFTGEYLMHVAAGDGDLVYLAPSGLSNPFSNVSGAPLGAQNRKGSGNAGVFLYNIGTRRFERFTYFGGATGTNAIYDMRRGPSGALYIAGTTDSQDLPLLGAFQTTRPSFSSFTGASTNAGFVAAFSGDLTSLQFSSYVGGQGGSTTVSQIAFPTSSSVRLFGMTYDTSLPGLSPAPPLLPPLSSPPGASPYTLIATPGTTGLQSGLLLGERNGSDLAGAVTLADGRACFLDNMPYSVSTLSPGDYLLSCLNPGGTAIQSFVDIGRNTILDATPSASGGLWILRHGGPVPGAFQTGAIPVDLSKTNSAIELWDTTIRKPVYLNQAPLVVAQGARISGKDFEPGMILSVGGRSYSITVSDPFTGQLNYDNTLDPGTYSGFLAVELSANVLASDTFDVIVPYAPPAVPAFTTTTANPRVLQVNAPVYDNSVVTWQGQALPLLSGPTASTRTVQIPAVAAGVFTLDNPSPGGGRTTETYITTSTGSLVRKQTNDFGVPALSRIYALDRVHRVGYTVSVTTAQRLQVQVVDLTNPTSSRIVELAEPPGRAVTALEVALDGTYLYALTDQRGVVRYRTSDFVRDAQFTIEQDLPQNLTTSAYRILAIKDDPGALLVLTPAGRLRVYDGDRPRPYGSTDFPSLIPELDPLLATRDAIYAVSRNTQSGSPVACVVRYPLDGFGLGDPENLCDLPADWGKYPELLQRGGRFFVTDGLRTVEAVYSPTQARVIRGSDAVDAAQGVEIVARGTAFSQGTALSQVRILDLNTRNPIAHYPAEGAFVSVERLALMGNTILITQNGGLTALVEDWQQDATPDR